jgi:hypothetical protein
MKKVKPVPDGYHTVNPFFACGDAAQAIAFHKKTSARKSFCVFRGRAEKSGTPSSASATRA